MVQSHHQVRSMDMWRNYIILNYIAKPFYLCFVVVRINICCKQLHKRKEIALLFIIIRGKYTLSTCGLTNLQVVYP